MSTEPSKPFGCPGTSTSRDLIVENTLDMISLPCRFSEEGCSERTVFSQLAIHEAKCCYRIFSCPATDCITWQGTALKLYDHFIKEHKECVKDNTEIKLQLAESTEGIFIVLKGTVIFVIKYLYDSSNYNFKYDIRYHAHHTDYNISFEIKLINDSESDFSINVKPQTCMVFDESFYDVQNKTLLNLKKFCETLDDPDAITLLINLTVTQTKANIQSLDLFRCAKCCNYLIPPLFDLCTVVCCDCGKNDSKCIPSNNEKLLECLSEINFPCRWRNCDFSGRFNVYKNHEAICKFRMHKCFFLNCLHYFTVSDAITHFKNSHAVEHCIDVFVNKIAFSRTFDWANKNTVKNDAHIFFKHKLMVNADTFNTYTMLAFSTNPESIISVNFEHQHCAIKPKPFTMVLEENLNVKLNQLPPCFTKNDEITVTVTIE